MMQVTPLVLEAHQRSKRFHTAIARRASLVPQRENHSYSIPNTPFGVPKIPPPRPPVVDVQAPHYGSMWFYDLVTHHPRVPMALFTGSLRIEDIQRAVAAHYSVSKLDINSARRTKNVVRPRQVAMYLAKVTTKKSLPEIGRRFGGRDHTTVLHAVRKIERLIKTDEALAAEVEKIKESLA